MAKLRFIKKEETQIIKATNIYSRRRKQLYISIWINIIQLGLIGYLLCQ